MRTHTVVSVRGSSSMTVSRIRVGSAYTAKQDAREALAAEGYAVNPAHASDLLARIPEISFRDIDTAMKRRDLSFEEAFVGMCYVLRATNRMFRDATQRFFADIECADDALAGREFLNGMAVKEAWSRVTAEEIAGMVAAAQFDIICPIGGAGDLFEICGTGGDIGFPPFERPRKVFNVSTLSSLVIASCGIRTMKHGSYANTSAVGSTDAIERFGARVEQRGRAAFERLFDATGYCFTDAHVVKTIHDLSHLPPRHETVNHIIGPMTPPIARTTRFHKVMGVSEKVHPEDVARAFALLHARGIIRVGNVAVLTGLDADIDAHRVLDRTLVKDHAILDELSPYASVVAFVRDGEYAGTFLLHPSDFGVAFPGGNGVALENTAEVLHEANVAALTGRDPVLTQYLAMNAGLALFVADRMSHPDAFDRERGPSRDALRECSRRCRSMVADGGPWALLRKYVEATGGDAHALDR